MDRGLHPRLQRVIERPLDPQLDDGHDESFSFGRVHHLAGGQASRQQHSRVSLNVDSQSSPPTLILKNGANGIKGPLDFEPISRTRPTTDSGSRLSIPPRNIYQPQEEDITTADQHFRFGQNLRCGKPANQPQTIPDAFPAQSPLSQLATNMLLPERAAQSALQLMNDFQSVQHDNYNQLQPRKQQITPPFNLSKYQKQLFFLMLHPVTCSGGFVYSPNLGNTSSMSSPAQLSSPTVRVSLRRVSTQTAPTVQPRQGTYTYSKRAELPQTPQRQTAPSDNIINRVTPHALSLRHAPPMAHGIQLVSPHELPDRFRQVFPYELFNAVQSKCFNSIYKSNDNIVVAAPTGSGKTCLLELAICKLVEGYVSGEFKIVYQAPTKSLCSERMRDWQKKFSHLNLSCAELTGDTSQTEMAKVRNASIIVTTPEKWDSITRKWTDFSKLLQMVKLFLIDEVHILKDTRGATLEAVVSRMKSSGNDVRFVALSATVPNSEDIAKWLGKDSMNDKLPAHRESFGEDFRPVRLQKHVHGFDGNKNDYAFEKMLDGKLPNLIEKYTHKKPIMVFCLTRKACQQTATMLAEWWTRQSVSKRAWPAPSHRTALGNSDLTQLASCGVAFHHAGLEAQDRIAIETAYLKGDISLICCTSTLAVGVNLPCHLVVLKGTIGFQNGTTGEYSDLEVMQMLGRAGRPQFDDSAVAIIMTRSEKVDRYQKMISGQDILESTLHLNLIEHLNSEISLHTIRDLSSAKKWLTGTFLSVRMRQNAAYYKLEGIPPNIDADQRLRLVCERDVKLLQDNELVTQTDKFTATEYGHAMSRYMVQFQTMKLLLSLSKGAKTEEIVSYHLACFRTLV